MNKKDLIERIAKNLPVSKNGVAKVVDSFFETIRDALLKGEKVTLSGFGTFYLAQRKEKRGINPQTKKPLVIPASKVPRFRPGKKLKEKIK